MQHWLNISYDNYTELLAALVEVVVYQLLRALGIQYLKGVVITSRNWNIRS